MTHRLTLVLLATWLSIAHAMTLRTCFDPSSTPGVDSYRVFTCVPSPTDACLATSPAWTPATDCPAATACVNPPADCTGAGGGCVCDFAVLDPAPGFTLTLATAVSALVGTQASVLSNVVTASFTGTSTTTSTSTSSTTTSSTTSTSVSTTTATSTTATSSTTSTTRPRAPFCRWLHLR